MAQTAPSVPSTGYAGQPGVNRRQMSPPTAGMPLAEADPELMGLINEEAERQFKGIELIASENFTTVAVMDCLGSCLTNKYSEGQAGKRYYGGNEVIDKIEILCKQRALEAFSLSADEWHVNVQPYSGSPANFAVYTALLNAGDRVMGLGLPSGGHLTHGYYTCPKAGSGNKAGIKAISATSKYFETMPYEVNPTTGLIDYDQLKERAELFRPRMIIAGASAYSRIIDWTKYREICDAVGAYLMVDMAHISGLVASGHHPAPFACADVITTTTHKSLQGPRSGMIFVKKGAAGGAFPGVEDAVDMAVFPGLQGGPHNHQIAGLCTQLKIVATPAFKEYSQKVVDNCKALAKGLMDLGHKLAADGTDNHLILLDVRPLSLTGGKVEKVCEAASISLNRNCVAGDTSALSPGGVRIGTPAMTTRGCNQEDMLAIAGYLDRACKLSVEIQAQTGKKLVDFERALPDHAGIAALRADVEKFGSALPIPRSRC